MLLLVYYLVQQAKNAKIKGRKNYGFYSITPLSVL